MASKYAVIYLCGHVCMQNFLYMADEKLRQICLRFHQCGQKITPSEQNVFCFSSHRYYSGFCWA